MDQPLFSIETVARAVSGTGARGSSDFDLNPEWRDRLPPGRRLRPAAVLVPLVPRRDGPGVILTRRATGLRHHSGQVAFPGGKVDAVDAGPEAAALREAEEEIGLPREAVTLIGALDAHETVTGFTVTPIVGLVPERFDPVAEQGEVEEVFEVPMAHVLDPANFTIHSRVWQGHERRYWAVPYGPHYIWGATARILKGLADRMAS